ncbi:MAG: hypothetical protein EBS06_08995 [Proteobacteria bacterium]|nr:hypothetical protein [Pseudomonadota bacterium]
MRFGPGGDFGQCLTSHQIKDLVDAAKSLEISDYPFQDWYVWLEAVKSERSFNKRTTMQKIQAGLFLFAAAKMYGFGRLEDLWKLLLALINQPKAFNMCGVASDFDQRNSSAIRLVYVFLNIFCWTPQSRTFVNTALWQLMTGPFNPDSEHDSPYLLQINDAADFNKSLWEALQEPIAQYLQDTNFQHNWNTERWSSSVLR